MLSIGEVEYLDVSAPSPQYNWWRRRAVELVVDVQRDSGFPPPELRDPETLRDSTAERQNAALSVWVAVIRPEGADEPLIAAHGLIEAVAPERLLYKLVSTHQQSDACIVYEVGGLAVSAQYQNSGLARELIRRLVKDVTTKLGPRANVVTATWQGGVSDAWAARHLRPLGAFVDELGIQVNAWLIESGKFPDT